MSQTDTDERWPYGTPFGDLVRTAKEETGLSYRKLAERAVDPATQTRVGYSTLHRIAHDQPIHMLPGVAGAISRAIGGDERRVRLAAAMQYCGAVAGDPLGASGDEATVVVVHAPGMGARDMPRVEALLKRYAAGDPPPELTDDA
ncbi:hypothetical protein OG496_31535 [Streptomyces sp. NBC_00988]|uniref:hypothetical protein n=1 Tax=Streptomyces sp. NBC_00988 TaxID=2903704 RepID=UPI003869468F|nr:hypothetical protein OG496_31535 [Streptomyces sp. NBC_00988]